ncbi:MAG: 3-hydroxyacyl-CoA dehydrogenase NAD-binding domain-containing protein [Hyphomicrobiales bacterium]
MALALTQFRFETDHDHIAHLIWDMPEKLMNVFIEKTLDELDQVVDYIAKTDAIKGCVISSGKADSFSGGADIDLINKLIDQSQSKSMNDITGADTEALITASSYMSRIYRKLETCGKIFAIALHGTCVGGAFELALACHHRVMSDDPKSKVGLPEIKIGIFPGAGGTQRVPRLAPTADALLMMLKGELINSEAALKYRLVDAIAKKSELIERAKAFILSCGSAAQVWDRKNYKLRSGPVYSKGGMMVWPMASAICRKETYDNYPAARALLQAVYEGLQVPFDLGLKIENRLFANILRTTEAKSMVRSLFVSTQALNKGARRPAAIPKSALKTIGLVGTGFMGAGIASISAMAGLKVIMIDQTIDLAKKGRDQALSTIAKRMKASPEEVAQSETAKNLIAADHYSSLSECDLVIEAVFEDPALKAKTLSAIEAHLHPHAILASNTSTLPISGLADALQNRNEFLGIHFFSPVDKMRLVELIKGKDTSERALAVGFDYSRLINKTPIIVNDGRGFFANRCVLNYLLEGHLMLAEGYPPAFIENVARMAGMPVGPLALSDEVALDLIHRIITATRSALGSDAINPIQAEIIASLVENHQRFGRKNGKGFYDYTPGAPKRLWAGLKALQKNAQGTVRLDVEEAKFRLLATQALEAARTMDENIVLDAREADIGAILGFGFAPFTGGPLSMIDGMGVANFNQKCEELHKRYGERFAIPQNLKTMANRESRFYT